MLKAYVDDTGKGDEPFFVLAAFVSTAEKWCAFSDAWDAKLKEPPAIAYFKMREAWSLWGEFLPFKAEQRDRRVEDLIKIVNQHAEFFVFCEINKRDWADILAKQIAKTLDNPFYHGYCTIMNDVFWHLYWHCTLDKVDFIFDKENETIFREILDWWLIMHEGAPAKIRRRMGNHPIMRDDVEVLPLQAADLLAWLTAKRNSTGEQREFARHFGRQLAIPGSHETWGRDRIEELLRDWKLFAGSKLGYEGGAQRSARLNQLFGPR
jgi:hypothetical protein